MIISRTPFRMSFFGGGTDIEDFYAKHGGAVLSATFDKYCYVNIRHLPGFFEYNTHLTYSDTEYVDSYLDIKHPLIRNAMKYLDIRDLRLIYDADLPARSGLGTSSSFAVGMLNAFYALKGKCCDKKKLADEAIYIERVLCQEAGGVQDQIAAAYGGLNKIEISDSGYKVSPVIMSNERKKKLSDSLMLFFTGFTRFSADVQKDVKKDIKNKEKQLLEMKKLVYDAENILSSGQDLNDFGKLLNYTWELKRGLSSGISTDAIDDLYKKAIESGALGGKLLGAGGGGFLLFFVEPDKQKSFLKRFNPLLHVPFEFENDGSSIIYYQSEDYVL
ncbi:MAG: kinase [Agathobacter sp.]|nr:kinase [Agathobacter sp.]